LIESGKTDELKALDLPHLLQFRPAAVIVGCSHSAFRGRGLG
jgi:hypothetical protein